MYVRYVTVAAPTFANIIADLAALLAGAAIVDLSASCDKVATTMVANVVAPGWTVFDAAAGGGSSVVSAPDSAGLITKFARLSMNSNALRVDTAESWNAATHVGVNIGLPPSATGVNLSTTAVNTLHIWANPRCFAIGEPSGGMTGCFEFSRDIDYLKNTVYPCYAGGNGRSMAGYTNATVGEVNMFLPRIKGQTVTGDVTGSGAVFYSGTVQSRMAAATMTGTPVGALQDSVGNYYHEVRPIWATLPAGGTNQSAILGVYYNIWEVTRKISNFFDVLTVGADTYMVIPNGDFANGNSIIMKVA